jgi:hypothetical protein
VNIQLIQEVKQIFFFLLDNYFFFFFLVNIHKRSWLHMLNPLARHKSHRSSDITSDFEAPLSTNTTGYIGKS